MSTLTVTLKLASPLLVGEPRRGNVYQSYSYLPGSVLRGAVAAVLTAAWTPAQRQQIHPDACPDPATCHFCRVFFPQDATGAPGQQPHFLVCYPTISA